MSEQFDERNNVFARRDLVPGSPEYEAFYTLHPEWKWSDDDNRSRQELGTFISAADMGFYKSPAWLMRQIGAPNIVDGSPSAKQIEISPERAAVKIIAFAKNLGADLVGISNLKQDYIYSHRGRQIYEEETWGSPIELTHKYSISLGFREDVQMIRTAPGSPELFETAAVYLKSAVVSIVLANYIRSLGYPARAHHFRNYQVVPVPLAVEAGLGELGRCGFLLTREFGNCLRLSTITTDLPLLCDEPVYIGVNDFCDRCKICAEACPSNAIPTGNKVEVRGVRKWQIDDLNCHTYWTKVGTDCGMCIASCPWSQPDVWYHKMASLWAIKSKLARKILLWLHPIFYGKYKPREIPQWVDPRQNRK